MCVCVCVHAQVGSWLAQYLPNLLNNCSDHYYWMMGMLGSVSPFPYLTRDFLLFIFLHLHPPLKGTDLWVSTPCSYIRPTHNSPCHTAHPVTRLTVTQLTLSHGSLSHDLLTFSCASSSCEISCSLSFTVSSREAGLARGLRAS